MNRGISSGQKKTIIIVLGVVIAFLVGTFITSTVVVIKASPDNPLPSYKSKDMAQPLGSAKNPFTILEIVPNVESATVGYLIKGCEPRNLLSIGATDKTDPDSAAAIYADAFASDTSQSSTIGEPIEAYIFKQDQGNIGTVPKSQFTEKYDTYKSESDPGTDKAYSEYGYYTRVTDGTGNYVYDSTKKCFEPRLLGDFTWTSVGEYQYVGLGRGNSSRVMHYLDEGEYKERNYSYNYNNAAGYIGDKAYNYTFNPAGDFVWVGNNNYNNENIFAENQTEMTYVEGNVTKTRPIANAQVGDKLYMTRTEDVYYSYIASEIICNDLLLKNLVNADATGLNYSTQVVTVTPAQLVHPGEKPVEDMTVEEKKAKELIDNADMIMVHNSSTGYKIAKALDGSTVPEENIPQFSSSGASKDLTEKTMEAIIERGSTAKPAAIVFDEDAINIANLGECQYLNRLYEVYNNLGAKLAYNWMSGQKYNVKIKAAETQPNYRNFTTNEVDALGRSNFVYNYIGNDDSWLTTAFADNNKISKTDKNSPAFENMGGGNTMSVAAMLSAVNKEANGYNQPRKLRILEIQPNEKYYYNPYNKDSWVYYYLSLFPWFIGNSKYIEDDVTVATMPTYEFIGRNEDPNENYDMILVGNKEQDETNGKSGYNDKSMNGLAYTAVGDLITTFGGDEMADRSIENNLDYRWHYGVYRNSKWSWTQHAYIEKDKGWYVYSKEYANFLKHFVYEYYDYKDGSNITTGLFGPWWYEYEPGGLFANGFDVYACKHGSDANMIGLRYSGNDLTKKKYDQLLDFTKQGPVIVADNMYGNSDNPDISKVDKSSFVYQLANKNKDSVVNKYIHGTTDRLNSVKKNMEEYKCSATFTNTTNNESGLPKEYAEGDAINYNTQKDSAGNNVLQYHFVLEGDEDTTYGVNVYTDGNGNGIFEGCINYLKEREANGDTKDYDSERASTLTIFDETVKGFVTDGNLVNGHTYLVTKIMPPSDIGMIPWKLEIYNKSNDSVRFSEIGYTRIRPVNNSQVKTIKVLQMNLNPDMTNNATNTVNFADNNSDVGKKFANYINQIGDFNIQIQFMDNQTWNRTYNGNRNNWKRDLMNYDMLVIGFKDSANFTNNEDFIYGFEEFRKAGKSIILTHDLVQDPTIDMTGNTPHSNTSKIIQSDVKYYLRDISGQIRKYYDAENYNVADPTGMDYDYMKYYSNGRRDLSFEPSDNFNIYTSIKETWNGGVFDHSDNRMTLENDGDYNFRPVYDKYTYTYGNFENSGLYLNKDGTLRHPDHRAMAITTPITVIRDYYKNHDNKAANMIMDNSIRSMLYYNYIHYVEDKKYSPDKKTTGFIDDIDRLVRNINLNDEDQRRKLVWGSEAFLTNKVKAANEGQITKYPFAIPDSIFVADTHAQNYQLDLEYDSDGDVLVWYNLAGTSNRNDRKKSAVNRESISVYDGKNQDSRNNYYIYTKGNVTYTGLGHSTSSNSPMSDDEIKLFINTMIAAYRSSASDPYITVLNPDAVTNGNNTTMYLEDRDIGSDGTIRYRIADDTTNSKIVRTYSLEVYKEGQLIQTIDSANLSTEYTIPVSFSDVKANGEVKYKIILKSTYRNDQGVDVRTESEQNVNVDLMPMFGLR
jgi:hypothetical protein